MGLNKSKGNMYKFITHTWNPLAGKCEHNCKYCSTNKLRRYPAIENKYSGEYRIIEKELKTNLGSDNFIFVCAQNDLFENKVNEEIIKRIISHCENYPNNRYLFQTKNPKRTLRILPSNSVVCMTIETNRNYKAISNAPNVYQRYLDSLLLRHEIHVTIEPIIDFDFDIFMKMIRNIGATQINIGADSGKNNLPEPSKEKTLELISELRKVTNVVLKDNLNRIIA
jgi:DNA repair photolyase